MKGLTGHLPSYDTKAILYPKEAYTSLSPQLGSYPTMYIPTKESVFLFIQPDGNIVPTRDEKSKEATSAGL